MALTDAQLCYLIERNLATKSAANEHRSSGEKIKDELEKRGKSFTVPASYKPTVPGAIAAGAVAQLEPGSKNEWLADHLKKVLPKDFYEAVCPPQPDNSVLNSRLEATPDDKELAACRRVLHTVTLKIVPPAPPQAKK